MSEVSPGELLNQLREVIAVLAASAEQQRQFLAGGVPVPVDDLFVQLDMIVPAWFARLEGHGLLDRAAEAAIMSLYRQLDQMSRSGDSALWASEDALLTRPEWEQVRERAQRALDVIASCPGPGDRDRKQTASLTVTAEDREARGCARSAPPAGHPGSG